MSEREHAAEPYGADLSMPHLGDDRVAPPRPQQRPHRRSLRSPELQRRPEPEYHQKGIGAAGDITIVRPAAAAPPRRPEQVELRRARVFGDHPPRDKEHHLASRKCRRESTPQNGQQPLHRPGGPRRSSNFAAPDSSAPTRQGIKSASAPVEKSGERAKRKIIPKRALPNPRRPILL